MRFPIDLDHYVCLKISPFRVMPIDPSANQYHQDIPSLREAYDSFATLMQDVPAFNTSFFLLEGYSVQAVQSVLANSTAFPHRGDTLLLSPVIYYAPDSSLDARAVEAGRELRQILHNGSNRAEMHSYVNYAHGDESVQNMYGFEAWRGNKLRRLKREYDPEERFRWYAPITIE